MLKLFPYLHRAQSKGLFRQVWPRGPVVAVVLLGGLENSKEFSVPEGK